MWINKQDADLNGHIIVCTRTKQKPVMLARNGCSQNGNLIERKKMHTREKP